MLKIGDKIMWRGDYGTEPTKVAVVESMQLHSPSEYALEEEDFDSNGEWVAKVTWQQVLDGLVLFSLTNGSWAFSWQVRRCTE